MIINICGICLCKKKSTITRKVYLSIEVLSLLLKKALAGRERLTSFQSEDPSPTISTHTMKEEKKKTAGDNTGESS